MLLLPVVVVAMARILGDDDNDDGSSVVAALVDLRRILRFTELAGMLLVFVALVLVLLRRCIGVIDDFTGAVVVVVVDGIVSSLST